MKGTTVAIVFFLGMGISQRNFAQPVVKMHASFPEAVRVLEISNALPCTGIHPGHYLLKLRKNTRKKDLKMAGLHALRQPAMGFVIVKSTEQMIRRGNHLFEHAISVNHLWKLSDALLNVSKTEKREFTIKFSSEMAAKRIIHDFPLLPIVYKTQYILIVEATLAFLLDHLIIKEGIEYIGSESRKPMEESRVLDLNLNPNAINRIHHEFPHLNGSGMTLSMQELHYTINDIDLRGRHVASSLGSSGISNHATDMATIAAGAGNSFITGKGVAPGAWITSSDFSDLFPDSDADFENLDAWVQNHSYGTVIENIYGALAEAYDQSANRNPNLLHVFSSGNQGMDTSPSGVYKDIVGYANLTGNSKMAKNVLTVGALDTTGNSVSFSSRGPAYDGRIKPEVVAYSTQGTSNSTALVSGIAILLQQAYKEKTGTLPESALLKAVLVNSAEDVGTPAPDFITGFGNVNAYRALTELNASHFIASTIGDGETRTFDLIIPFHVKNFKLTLAWNDPAASVNSSRALVNDLDITLENSENKWYPWKLDVSPTVTSLKKEAIRGEDHLNTIEQITLNDVSPGTYTIAIKGFDVPDGIQPFYICYQWDAENKFVWDFPTGSDNMPYNGETGTYFYWHSTLEENTGRLEFSLDNGNTWSVISGAVELEKGRYRWAYIPEIAGMAKARMVVGNAVFETDLFSISRPIEVSVGFHCADSAMIQWQPVEGAISYAVYGYTDAGMNEITSMPDTAYIFHENELNTQLFAVQPLFDNGSGIRSPTYDYTTLGTECFIFSFQDEVVPEEGVYLNLTLGTTYGVDRLIFERQTTALFQSVGSIGVGTYNVIQFLDDQPAQGFNRYRVRLQLQNGEEIISDTLENFFITEKAFSVFPNPVPVGQALRIFSKAFENPVITFRLYRTDGTLLSDTQLFSDREFISLDAWPPGLYVYSIQSEEGYYKGKLIIVAK
jgi:hypothetical protein